MVQVDVAMQHTDGYTETVRCFANNIYNPDGGTHESGFRGALTRSMNNYGKKQNKVRNAFLGEFADVGYSVAVRI